MPIYLPVLPKQAQRLLDLMPVREALNENHLSCRVLCSAGELGLLLIMTSVVTELYGSYMIEEYGKGCFLRARSGQSPECNLSNEI